MYRKTDLRYLVGFSLRRYNAFRYPSPGSETTFEKRGKRGGRRGVVDNIEGVRLRAALYQLRAALF